MIIERLKRTSIVGCQSLQFDKWADQQLFLGTKFGWFPKAENVSRNH